MDTDNLARARAWFTRLLHDEDACQGMLTVDYATDLAARAICAVVAAKGEAILGRDWSTVIRILRYERFTGPANDLEEIVDHAAIVPEVEIRCLCMTAYPNSRFACPVHRPGRVPDAS